MRLLPACLLAALITPATAVAQVLIPEPRVHDLVLPDGTEHRLIVALPRGYDARPDDRYPVLYVLDGNTMFAMMVQAHAYMEVFGELGPILIVGLGYPTDDWHEVLQRRARDYTPTRHAATERQTAVWLQRDDVLTGGADEFLDALRTRVIPLVEETYRTTGTRAVAGFSYGGLFAFHTLLTAPETFRAYLIGSPSLGWDDEVMFRRESDFSARASALPARVFLSAGSLEQATAERVQRLDRILRGRGYEGLELTTHVFPDETHLSVIPATLSRGVRTLFGQDPPTPRP